MTRTDTEAGLLLRVQQSPDDDAPRRMLADLWMDSDDEATRTRGEFVAVQLELATTADPHGDRFWDGQLGDGPESYRRREALRRREWELFKEHGRDWFDFPADGLLADITDTRWVGIDQTWFVSRGFVSEVRLTLAAFLGVARRLFACQPVTAVRLSDKRAEEWQGGWSWFSVGFADDPATLPQELFDRLFGDCSPSMQGQRLTFQTEAEANSALSRACVTYGRALAGLTTGGTDDGR